jgi:beta-lactamase regulating signal transducer with metallopeptidase domain
MTAFAQLAVERVLNSLPEGLLIAFCAWLLLRLMGRQNAGTRYAVWLVALAGVAGVPLLSGLQLAQLDFPRLALHAHSEFAVPAFWALAFFVLWIAIAAFALARVVAGVLQVRRIRRSCTEISIADLDPSLQDLISGIRRPIRLLASEEARVPAALGFRNPAIVLPAWTLRDLSASELRPILIHELAHLRRHDDWTNLAQKAVRAVLFFHPAVWWIDTRLSLEREMACDDAVVAATGNPRAYAGCLIDLLEKGCARRGWSMAQAAVARARDASVRIARILRIGPGATTRVGRATIGIAASLSLACAGVALCAPQFVEFVPMRSASAAQITKPLIDGAVGFRASAVVPASFHPARKPSLVSRTVVQRSSSSTSSPLRQVAEHSVHASKSPYMMARLERSDASDRANAAAPTPTPMLVVFETRPSTATVNTSALLRTIGAEPANTKTQQLQSREDPDLQIQMFQVIDPETGTPIQVMRIVLTVPQMAGSISQAI